MAATIDKDLTTTLKAARGGNPMRFAFLPKGSEGKLLVGKKCQRFAHGRAADAERGGDRRLGQTRAGRQASPHDRLPQRSLDLRGI